MDHFDKKEEEASNKESGNQVPEVESNMAGQAALQKQLQQIAGGQPVLQNVAVAAASNNTNNPSKFQQCIAEGDLDFVSSNQFFLKLTNVTCLFVSVKILVVQRAEGQNGQFGPRYGT